MTQRIIDEESFLNPLDNETYLDYLIRVGELKKEGFITLQWDDIARLIDKHFGISLSGESARKRFSRHRFSKISTPVSDGVTTPHQCSSISDEDEIPIELSNRIRIEGMKLNDQRTAINRDLRNVAREEILKDIANSVAKEIASSGRFIRETSVLFPSYNNKVGILCISDWHYGLDINNYYNVYSPEICKERVATLRDKTLSILKKEKINKLIVVNLGDMIAGLIHNSIRYNSRVDVITQILEVNTIIAEFLTDLSTKVTIDYYDTLDNHSRIDVNKDETTKLCQLSRITAPFLEAALQNNDRITIHKTNNLSESIIRFDLFNKYKIAGTHGDKDKPNKAINNITGYSQEHIDLLLMAHRHHFSADEQNFTMMFCNGSLMGTDDFAESLRLSSTPSQTLIISSEDNVAECVYTIKLN